MSCGAEYGWYGNVTDGHGALCIFCIMAARSYVRAMSFGFPETRSCDLSTGHGWWVRRRNQTLVCVSPLILLPDACVFCNRPKENERLRDLKTHCELVKIAVLIGRICTQED